MANHLILSNQSDTLELINSYQLLMKYMCNFVRDMKLKVFLDISKAFDKIWNEIFIFKSRWNGVSGKLLRHIKEFLSDRKQRMVLSGQCLSWIDDQAVCH